MVDFGKKLRELRQQKQLEKEEKTMGATQGQLAILNEMAKYTGQFAQAVVKKNPFGAIKLPVGEFIVQLAKCSLSMGGPAGKPKKPGLTFIFIAVASIEGDPQFQGEQVRVLCQIGESGNQTLQDSIDRMIYQLQDLGINTEVLSFQEPPPPDKFGILQLCEWLSTFGIYYKGAVTESESKDVTKKGVMYKNLNIKERLTNAFLSKVLGDGNFTPMQENQADQHGGVDPNAIMGTEVTGASGVDDGAYDNQEYEAPEGEEAVEMGEGVAWNGEVFYLIADNTECDQWGNPPGTTYEDLVPPEPEYVEAPPVQAPAPPAPKPAPARSPPTQNRAINPQPARPVAAPPAKAAPVQRPAQVPPVAPAAPKPAAGTPVKRVGPPKRPGT